MPDRERRRHELALEPRDVEDDCGRDNQNDGGAEIAESHRRRQHRQRQRGRDDRAPRVDRVPLLRDEVGEENDQRGLGEFGRLQRPDALQAEPAMRFAVEEEDQDLQEQHHAERAEGPGRDFAACGNRGA